MLLPYNNKIVFIWIHLLFLSFILYDTTFLLIVASMILGIMVAVFRRQLGSFNRNE